MSTTPSNTPRTPRGFLAAAIFAILALPVQAQDVTHPNMQDMQNWKRDLIDRYDKATYLDEQDRPISEGEFFRRVVDEKRGLSYKTEEGSHKQIVLRLLANAEQRSVPVRITPALK